MLSLELAKSQAFLSNPNTTATRMLTEANNLIQVAKSLEITIETSQKDVPLFGIPANEWPELIEGRKFWEDRLGLGLNDVLRHLNRMSSGTMKELLIDVHGTALRVHEDQASISKELRDALNTMKKFDTDHNLKIRWTNPDALPTKSYGWVAPVIVLCIILALLAGASYPTYRYVQKKRAKTA